MSAERIEELKRAMQTLRNKHGQFDRLERRLVRKGVTADDHTLYADWLEWQAIRYELAELIGSFEMTDGLLA